MGVRIFGTHHSFGLFQKECALFAALTFKSSLFSKESL
jgi:hypothetical protein